MKLRGFLALFVLATPMIAPGGYAATPARTVREQVGQFDAIVLHGRFRLDFTQGETRSVKLSGDPYLVENLNVSVKRGVLDIDRPSALDLPKNETVDVIVTAPSLAALTTKGLVRADLRNLSGRAFDFINDGATAATISGKVGKFRMISRGVASIDASRLLAVSVNVSVRGQGNMRVFARDIANITLYGEGKIEVLGHPKDHTFKTLAYGIVTLH